MTTEHQPGSPGVDLDALERRLELDLGSWGNLNTYRRVFAELRTLRARVAELEMPDTEADRILTMSDEELDAEIRAVGIDPAELDTRASHVAKWAAECSKLRARVGELEGPFVKESTRADAAEARADSAEARVKELEIELLGFEVSARKRNARITSLESQLAAAREEQGLEALVRSTLKERNDSLLVRFETPWWKAEWRSESRSVYGHARRNAQGATLPALLRAILEEEGR